MKTQLIIVGILSSLIWIVWIGQGSCYLPYPASSFMIQQTQGVYYGACLALVGLFLIGFTRR